MRPAIFDLLSKQPFPKKHLVASLLNVSSCLFLVFAVWVETNKNSTSFVFKEDLDPSSWALKDRVITLSMSTLLYALYVFDGVIYCKFIPYRMLICRDSY